MLTLANTPVSYDPIRTNNLTINTLNVGDNSSTFNSGNLTLSAGAKLTTINSSTVGTFDNSIANSGTLSVDGSGTSFTSNSLNVGFGGIGLLSVTSSAAVNLVNLFVGFSNVAAGC